MTTHLQQNLNALCAAASNPTPRLGTIIKALVELLEELSAPNNNTDYNCRYVDNEIMARILFDEHVLARLSLISPELVSIIEDCGMNLHDTHCTPDIAKNFASTPQQLLLRARCLEESSGFDASESPGE